LSFNRLGSIFVDFFTIVEKTLLVPLVPCPNLVPGLSHAFSGTGKPLKKGRLALFFVLVPLIFNKSAPQPDTKGERLA